MAHVVQLEVCLQNLTVVSKVACNGRLRMLRTQPEATTDGPTPDLATPATHRLVLENRWLMQGVRRAVTGDGHGPMITFLREVLENVQRHANSALAQDDRARAQDARATFSVDADAFDGGGNNLFDRRPREVLRHIATELKAARTGLDLLRTSTYANMEQVGVDLQQLMDEMEHVLKRIEGYLDGTLSYPSAAAVSEIAPPRDDDHVVVNMVSFTP